MTSVQKYVSEWLKRQGGQGIILTGYKSTIERDHNGTSVMCCSVNVVDGLKAQKIAQWTGRFAWKGAPIYQLTNP